MLLTLLKAKLHHARVTQVELEYEGSCAIDAQLLKMIGIIPNEQIHIYNLNNGERFITYAIEAPAGSGIISVNGAAAHKAHVGDRVIISSYAAYQTEEIAQHAPKVLRLDAKNRPVHTLAEACSVTVQHNL